MNPTVILAIFRKELTSYFSSPTGYVFVTLFVFLSGVAAFWTDTFFTRNLANLDQLNTFFPALLLFLIPAITMASWAEERKAGTDELLMTLPAKESDLMLGKYLGCVAIYTVCLVFALSHIVVLAFLGRPDVGLMISTYLGYWLAGVALCGIGLFASAISSSATISFILCALSCGLLVGIGLIGEILPARSASAFNASDVLREISIPRRMESFGRGVVDPADVLYFIGVGLLGVWLATRVVAGRRSNRDSGLHLPLRGAALATVVVCAVVLIERTGVRADATAERLWSISPQTRELIGKLDPERPVIIQAFVSPKVPPALVQTRETLLGLLRELEAIGRGRIAVQMTATEPNTEQSRDAERSFGIRPRQQLAEERAGGSVQEVFLGIAVSAAGGGDPVVIPFLSQGLPVEYELVRAIRGASTETKKTIGIMDTEASLFGRFDFATMRAGQDWPIVNELRKQYKVQRVASGAEVPKDVDVLIVAQPSTMNPMEFEKFLEYVKGGRPAIVLEDPMPMVKPEIATNEPRKQANTMMGGDPRANQPKADLKPLWDLLGARVVSDAVVWDSFNPHPVLAQTPSEFIWLTQAAPWARVSPPFHETDPITSGLQEVVLLFAGRIEKVDVKPPVLSAADAVKTGNAAPAAAGPQMVVLMRSSPSAGQMPYSQILTRSFFGTQFNENRRPTLTKTTQSLAAHIRGKSGDSTVNVVLLGDLDMISPTFFDIREQGSGALNLEFDNVTFILNAVDVLAADNSLLDLRKKRRQYRTLETLEKQRQAELAAAKEAQELAETDAQTKLAEAQARVEAEVKRVQDRTDLDDSGKRVMAETVRRTEQRRLDVQSRAIEDSKRDKLEDIRLVTRNSTEQIQTAVRIAAVAAPPIPALAIGVFVLVRRRRMERESGKKERF